jgi:hypothetical protein
VIGSGNGQIIRNIHVESLATGGIFQEYRGAQPFAGVAVGISGGGGGASRTVFENCSAQGFYTGWRTDINNNGALCDSNTWRHCLVIGTFNGIFIGAAQNFINSVEDCLIGGGGFKITNNTNQGCLISGGNISGDNGCQSKAFTISAVSALTVGGSSPSWNVTFTATISASDGWLQTGIYNAWAFVTAKHGVVPCTITAYNAGTGVATFQILPHWLNVYYANNNVNTASHLGADLQTLTTAYACEYQTVLWGNAFHVVRAHLELDQVPHCMIRSGSGFGNAVPNKITQIQLNSDCTMQQYAGGSPDAQARYFVAHGFPFIQMDTINLDLDSMSFAANANGSPIIDFVGGVTSLRMHNVNNINMFATRVFSNAGPAWYNFLNGEWYQATGACHF